MLYSSCRMLPCHPPTALRHALSARILYCATVGLDAGDLAGGRARVVSLPNPIVVELEGGRVVTAPPWWGAPNTSGAPGVVLAAAPSPAGPLPGVLASAV